MFLVLDRVEVINSGLFFRNKHTNYDTSYRWHIYIYQGSKRGRRPLLHYIPKYYLFDIDSRHYFLFRMLLRENLINFIGLLAKVNKDLTFDLYHIFNVKLGMIVVFITLKHGFCSYQNYKIYWIDFIRCHKMIRHKKWTAKTTRWKKWRT